MSFSKARIQRFNEFENHVPAPGTYDPKFDVKVKGSVIEKSERFHDDRSTVSAEGDYSVCTKSMSHVAASYRTPQLPRKIATPKACSKTMSCLSSSKKLQYKSQHQLADLQVECSNKNMTIQEHEKLIENMREEVHKLELELKAACARQTEIEDQHRKDMEIMAKMQQDILSSHNEKHQEEVERFRSELLQVSEEKDREIQARKEAKSGFRVQIADFTQKLIALETELSNEREASKEKIHNLEKQIEELKMKLEKLIESHKNEVELLEQDKSKLNSNITNLSTALADREKELKGIIIERNAKINAMIMEAKTAVEKEMRLTTERYEACLVHVKTERAALDKKLEQKGAEIARLSATLENLKSSVENEESFGHSLQMELDRAEAKLTKKKEELRILKDQIQTKAAEAEDRKQRFEIMMAENQTSVTALAEHLIQSNIEVEKLQRELKLDEDSINEYCNLLNIMCSNTKMVQVQMLALMEELSLKKELVVQSEVESSSDVDIKSLFEAKIEDLKQKATKQLTQLQIDYDAKDAQNVEMKNQLIDLQNTLLKLEEENDAQERVISKVELINTKLRDELEHQSTKYELIINEARIEIQELSDTIQYLQKKETSVEDKTELLEEERARREAAEEEVKKLIEHNKCITKEYEEISAKYAELVGHQNLKQRIKHVSQLKDKINLLEQELLGKNRTIKQQQKTIEKLQTEERRMLCKEKENTLGITRTMFSTSGYSPQKTSTPLKNRNE